MIHYVSKDDHIFKFSPQASPALTINPGKSVRLEVMDCFSNQIQNPEDRMEEVDWDKINPATGPVYISGAKKGDVLKVTVEAIKISDQAVMLTGKDLGVLGHKLEGLHSKILPVKDGKVIFDDKTAFDADPMIGVIGVAPEEQEINCGTPDVHGGNMDTTLIREGSVVYLPVWAEGGLLAAGDLHAVMGDGEVCVSGAEVSGEVQLNVVLVKELNLPTPLVENKQALAVIYSHEDLDEAVTRSVEIMEELIGNRTGLSTAETAMLLSAGGRVSISQVVDPLKTARCEIPKWILDNYGFSLY